jgi:Xaa-Pro aminopeptidase
MDPALRDELRRRCSLAWRDVEAQDAHALIVYAADGRGQNIRYLTNFSPIYGDAVFVMTPERQIYLLNFDWEIPRAREDAGLEEFIASFDIVDQVSALLRDLGITRGRVATVGFDRIPHPMFVRLATSFPGIDFIDITASLEQARRIKSPHEIAQLRRAVEITEAGVRAVREAIRPGLSEVELAALAEYTMKAAGATVLAFPTLVLSGPERVVPVGMPTGRRVQEGDVVMLDLGATWNGYQADLSRTLVIGRATQEQERAYQVVMDAWQRAVDNTRPGVRCDRLQKVAAQVVAEAGYTLAHRIGHGVGLATSLEWPNLQNEEEPLAPGMTLCIEPAICLPGIGTLKVEDDLVVTEDGSELLSTSDRTL